MNNKIYDVLKWVGLILFPALAWFVGEVGPEWGWQYVDQIVKTLNAAGALLGILIGASTIDYNRRGRPGDWDQRIK